VGVSEAALEASLERAGYRLGRIVGEGGMGRVYAATQLSMGRQVAVKTLLHGLTGDDTFLQRFQREAKISARLRSPHVVLVIDGGRLDCGVPYFVMELLEGKSFSQLLKEGGPLPATTAVAAMISVTGALVEAHSLGVLHRDVKPANVFQSQIKSSGKTMVKLLDFGVAKHELEASLLLTGAGVCLGSTSYMAPEQAVDPAGVDERADVFGVGATLHALVSGEAPFGRRKIPSALERPRRPLPWPELDDVIARCVHWDPRGRYKSMKALLAALRALRT
jgi:serine/threonine protein kinase